MRKAAKNPGFTLAELLVSLMILAEIATFAIPKILVAQQSQRFRSAAKETISMLAGAYSQYQLKGNASSSTTMGDLTPYMNFVQYDTSASVIDDQYTMGSTTCDPASYRWCLKLHQGGTLLYFNTSFSGTGSTNAINAMYDPDGSYSGSTTGTGKSLMIYIYYNGRVTDTGQISAGTVSSSGTFGPTPSLVPSWFSW